MAKVQTAAKAAETNETVTPVTPVNVTPVTPEPTSERLTQLKAEQTALKAASKVETDEKKSDEIMMQWWAKGEEIKSEIASIKKNEIELLKKEKEAGLLRLIENLLITDRAVQVMLPNADTIPLEEKDKISDAFKTAYEIVANKVLGSSKVHPTTSASNGNGNGTKGATTKEIVGLITPLYAEGKTGKEVRAFIKEYGGGGAWTYFNDGTANGAIKAYERANGISE